MIGYSRYFEVQALLDRLKQSTHQISFVLAIGEDAQRHVDFRNCVTAMKSLTRFPLETTQRIIKAFVENRLRDYSDDITWGRFSGLKPGFETSSEIKVPEAIVGLCAPPELLNRTSDCTIGMATVARRG